MSKTQWIVIIAAVALFVTMYFGCETKPGTHKIIEKQRALAAVSTDINTLLMEAKSNLPPEEGTAVLALEAQLHEAENDSVRVATFKDLSSMWYQVGKPAIAGYYAEQVANIEGNEDAWSIAGTTFSICVQRETEEKVKSYCTDHAIAALENASSLNPENVQHHLNLAIVYAENPPSGNPMKGILMLIDLVKKNPDNVPVLNQLGRLAIKTGQFDKAIERLSHAVSVEPENPTANCLLGQAYESSGNLEKASEYTAKCKSLTMN